MHSIMAVCHDAVNSRLFPNNGIEWKYRLIEGFFNGCIVEMNKKVKFIEGKIRHWPTKGGFSKYVLTYWGGCGIITMR